MRAMEYRVNFLTWTIVDIFWSIMDVVFYLTLINFTQVIGNWNKGQALIVLGIFRLMVIPVWGWMFSSFSLLPRLISEGRLDLILTKPVDSQFLVSTRDFSFSILPSLFSGLVFTLWGARLISLSPDFSQIILTLWLLGVSTLLSYGVYFVFMSTTLYFDRIDNIHQIFTALYDSTKYPSQIYPVVWQRVLTTVLPLAIIIVVPAEALFMPQKFMTILNFHLLTLAFLAVGRFIWISGLRRYSSASS
jgi:ABC-2 type transport system permease protein